jgi:hypothetical protein
MSIKIIRNEEANCITFRGTSVPAYFNACLSGVVSNDDPDLINVRNDIRSQSQVEDFFEFSNIHYSEFEDKDGNPFASALDVANYVTEQGNVLGLNNAGEDLTNITVNFKLDQTSTSIVLDNGYSFGVNTIKAVADGGLIKINSIAEGVPNENNTPSTRVHFEKLDHTLVTVNGNPVSGGLNDVINTLNELFTVGAFESVVIADPYSTMVADVSGVDTTVSYVGYGVDPLGDDVYGSTNSNSQNGLKTTETINQAGEYFTFDIRVEGTIGFGLVHSQDSYDDGYWSGNVNYADPTRFGVDNSAHYGFQFSHWFHPTPNGSWTNYGANTSYSMRAGWSNWDQQQDWLDGNPVKIRVGIDSNSYISIESLQNDGSWVVHSRTTYPVVQGSEFHLGIKTNHTGARVYTLPKVHLLEEAAPTMYFRYIESPDGVFNYPLFTTQEEAEYYDEIVNGLAAGTGSSHTHTYVDDPTNTTWYMPEATHDTSTYQHSSAPDGTETFSNNPVTYTEITSLTNADLTPTAFGAANITQEEGTNVNIQVTPAGATWSSSVTITPSGSGLVYDGYSLIQGTLSDVGSDTTYTVEVTRANAYGSSVGSMTVTSTDVAPVQSNDTPWTKALDFSGSNEHAKMVTTSTAVNAIRMGGGAYTVAANADSNKTADGINSRPWATAIVFQTPNNNGNQHIWNSGEGAGNNDDNIYLRMSGSNGELYFGWGREGVGYNEYHIGNFGGSYNQSSGQWWGIYIAHNGARFKYDATPTNLVNAFDIRLMGTNDVSPVFSTLYDVGNDVSKWTSSGVRMDRTIGGDFTIGGRGANRSFHGKVASMVVTTLRANEDMPTDAEIKLMLTDPVKWVDDYKVGNLFRYAVSNNVGTFAISQAASYFATQVWLMGDGALDSYSNMIRNYIYPSDQNYTKLQLNSMVSNDFQTVNIQGLT